jgi:hypothetical protein
MKLVKATFELDDDAGTLIEVEEREERGEKSIVVCGVLRVIDGPESELAIAAFLDAQHAAKEII